MGTEKGFKVPHKHSSIPIFFIKFPIRNLFLFTVICFALLMTSIAHGDTTSINLSTGWNLISVPYELTDNNVTNVLANIQDNVEIVWGFTPPDTWVKYGPTLPSVLNTLTELVPGKGYWIKAKADITNFSVSGTEKALTLNFAKDWNLIGINGSTSQNIATLLFNIKDNVEIVWGFTPPDTWVKYGPTLPSVLNTLTELVPGKGYWIKTTEAFEWEQSAWAISTIDTTGDVGKYTSITTDANRKVHISYYDITNQKLKYATNLSGSWVVTPVANAPSTADGTSIAIDTNGKVHIAYEGTNGALMYATNSSGSWVPTVVQDSAWLSDVSMALDSNNKVHISYLFTSLKYATNSTGSWATSIIVNGGNPPLPAYSTSIDLDSNNKVHICYYDDSSPDSIKYITNASGSWQITQIDTIGLAAGWETSLVVDSSNKVHISYYDWTNDALKYATNSSGTWQTYTIDSTSGNVWYAAITVDSSKYVHISYNSNIGLMYATNSSGSWAVSKVDEAWTGSYSSIAIDTGGGVHISYHDGGHDSLKYATK